MSPDVKAKLTFVILGSVYFAGGIEIGISVPRGWLHWRRHAIQAPDHIVGLSVAAYSVATFFLAPVVGRWVDKPGRSRRVLALGACLHITGATMEIFLTNQWATVVSRFISGIGGGADAAVLSETSRYTARSHRTSAMALLVGARLLGFLLVPGVDSLLWRVVLTHIQLPERRTAALGLFLVVMWTVMLLLLAALYTELCRLQPPSHPTPTTRTLPFTPRHLTDHTAVPASGSLPSSRGEGYVVSHDAGFSSSQPISIPASLTSSICSESSTHHGLGKSSEMIEEAEKYIQRMAEQSFSSAAVDYADEELESGVTARHCDLTQGSALGSGDNQMSTSFNHDSQRSGSLGLERGRRTHRVSGVSVTVSSEVLDQNSYVKRSGILPTYLQRPESLLYILYEEFIRHDVIALLAISMSSVFALLCFQMMIVPVSQRFLQGDDLYSVIVFCLALVWLVGTCGCVWGFSPRSRVLHVMVCGTCVLLLAILLFMAFLYHMEKHHGSAEGNLLWLGVCVGLYVMGLPLVLIPATSVFTMLSDLTHHGLRQGVYHSALSVSAILAPLWIEGTTTLLFLHHSVIVGLLLVSLVTICCSGSQLSALHAPATRRRGVHRHRAMVVGSSERQRLLT